MRILYISNTFPRENESSTIFTDLAEELVKRGHYVVVVAGEEKKKLDHSSFGEERGIQVLRVKTGNMFEVSFLEKGISIITLVPKFISEMRKNISKDNFDIILFESPPVTISKVVSWAKKEFNCPSYLMLKDIFPQNAIDLEIISKNSLIHRYFKFKEKELYEISNMIGCMSTANKEYLIKNNPFIDENKIQIFPNTKKIKYNLEKPLDFKMRRKYGIPENSVVVVFGGNMGIPQGIDFLIEVLRSNNNRNEVFFLLVGRGTERDKIKKFLSENEITNSLLIENLPRDDYESLVVECDIGLIFLNHNFSIPNYPSRVLSYFEYCLPVFAATDTVTDFGEMIEFVEAGIWVESDNIDEFNRKLNKLVNSPEKRTEMGYNGRKHLEEKLHVGVSVDILENYIRHINRNSG